MRIQATAASVSDGADAMDRTAETESGVEPLAEIRDLSVRFVSREATVHAVNGVSFTVNPGEVLCILGESGSGKSVTLRALMRLLPPRRTRIEGGIRIDGQDVLAMRPQALRDLRGGLAAMIFQGTDDGARPGLHRR